MKENKVRLSFGIIKTIFKPLSQEIESWGYYPPAIYRTIGIIIFITFIGLENILTRGRITLWIIAGIGFFLGLLYILSGTILEMIINFLNIGVIIRGSLGGIKYLSKTLLTYKDLCIEEYKYKNYKGDSFPIINYLKYIFNTSMIIPGILSILILLGVYRFIMFLGVDINNNLIYIFGAFVGIVFYIIFQYIYHNKLNDHQGKIINIIDKTMPEDLKDYKQYGKKYKQYIILENIDKSNYKSKYIYLFTLIKRNSLFSSVIFMSIATIGFINFILYKDNHEICSIKGNISYISQEKIYHLTTCADYSSTVIDESQGEKRFCSEQEAIINGWRIAKNCKGLGSDEDDDLYDKGEYLDFLSEPRSRYEY